MTRTANSGTFYLNLVIYFNTEILTSKVFVFYLQTRLIFSKWQGTFMCIQTKVCIQYGLAAFYVINVLKSYNWECGQLYFQTAIFFALQGPITDYL